MLLEIYLNREAAQFHQRFSTIVDEVETTIQELSDRVEVIASTLRTVANSAWNAEDAATEARTLAEQLNDDMQNLARIAENPPPSEATSYAALRQIRQQAWIAFSNDAAFRRTKSSPKLAVELKTYLELPIDPHDWLTYHYETLLWTDTLKTRGLRGTMAHWTRSLIQRSNLQARHVPSLRGVDRRPARRQ